MAHKVSKTPDGTYIEIDTAHPAEVTPAILLEWHKAGEAEGYEVRATGQLPEGAGYTEQARVQQAMASWVLVNFRLPDGRTRTQWVSKKSWSELPYEPT